MKKISHIYYIIITLAAVVATALLHSCTNYEYRRELLVADSLISENPEKATAMLDSMKAEMPTAPEHERMYYELLRIKAADKAYKIQKSDSTILKLIDYYENGGDTRILPEAYYYAGSVCRDMNDAPRAIDFFQKAENKLNGSENYRLLSNINAQKGFIFSKQYLYREAMHAYFKAYKYDSLLKDTVNIVYSLIFLANAYKNIEKADSSIMFFQKAVSLATKTNNKEVIGDANAQMASLYIKQKDYKSALKLLSQNLNDTANTEKSPNYSMAVRIYICKPINMILHTNIVMNYWI